MRPLKKLKILAVLFLVFVSLSCEKEESIDLTGNLVVSFGNNKVHLSKTNLPSIYIADSDISEALVEKIPVDKNYSLRVDDLNYGNYYLVYYKEYNNYYTRYTKLFQINAGKTTTLTIHIP